MRTSHFQAFITKGPAMARELADLAEAKVEAKHEHVTSKVYTDVYKELSARLNIESAKQIARDEVSPNGEGGKKH